MNLLTSDEYNWNYSFEVAYKIHKIPPEMLDQGYVFASFNIESLFPSLSLNRTTKEENDREQLKRKNFEKVVEKCADQG